MPSHNLALGSTSVSVGRERGEVVGGWDTMLGCEAVEPHFSPNIYLDQF